MADYFADYYWKKGVPQGIGLCDPVKGISYKIVTDPYHKRYTIEIYESGVFFELAYDSFLLDFRKLTPVEQTAWQREAIHTTPDETTNVIRNIDDRIIVIETIRYVDHLSRECIIHSPHQVLLAKQVMFYEKLQDPFNGVILYDRYDKPVMVKVYSLDEKGEFAELLEEYRDMSKLPAKFGGK
jgi:hypothetical protein